MPPETRIGLFSAFGAYLIWGILPLYLKWLQIEGVDDALEIVAHRILWAVVFVGLFVWWTGKLGKVPEAFRSRRLLVGLGLSAVFIGINWGVYTWAVASGRILEASLGYYINPIINVALGTLLLREKMRAWQWVAFGLALCGVAFQTLALGIPPWVSLALAFSFALYGFVKKKLMFDAPAGFLVEAMLLAPIAGIYLLSLAERGEANFGTEPLPTLLLVLTGPVTALPLILFAAAAGRLKLTTIGFIQYFSPTLQLLIAIGLGERFTAVHAVTFACIWAGLATYSLDSIAAERHRRAQAQGTAGAG